ncbi:FGGY-family carbohydrate kinase [Bailinhaonella thermotolerans]|uniref:Sugar kinase n=1 Tax=Bailinhaonella thermotolerans TaxID=1070861 RepID=A0A3A4B7Y2_9ACTN|nr:FGGY-family carbohydrate kinase [Bailinhaonella thermotolerans]RJL33594.1 sugar kinase [Bailinhaonella thermotolerans]
MPGLLLGVDIGTSGSKGVLVGPEGEVIATARRTHEVLRPRPGWVEQDAEKAWWREFCSISAELCAGRRIEAVAVSGMGPCVLPASETGEPLRPAILYGVDTRATRQIRELRERYGPERVLERCGSPLTTQAVGPKLAWIRENEPDVWARTRRFFTCASFLVYHLTGAYALDHHSASQSVPLYDSREHRWIEDWADEIAPGVELPRLLWPDEFAGEVTPEAAAESGIPAGTPVTVGTIDAWAESVSVGVREPGDVMVMYGTTMFLLQVLGERRTSPNLWGTVGIDPGTYNFGAGMATSGAITNWLHALTGAPYEELIAEAARVPRGSEGLLMLPYFAGERAPLFDADARGTLIGLTLHHGRGHLYRATLEATAFGVRHNLETMREAGAREKRLMAVGGGTRGHLWPQIVTDVLQEPQTLPTVTQGASYGNAHLAARALGRATRETCWNTPSREFHPDPEAAQVYDARYHLYRRLYESTKDIAHILAREE